MTRGRLPMVSVGNDLMDEQHRVLLELVDRLHQLAEKEDRAALEQGLVELYGRALRHFEDEELLLEIIAFPWLDDHRMAHHQFAGQLAQLMTRFRRSGFDYARQALTDLQHWLSVHIRHDDLRYATILIQTKPAAAISISGGDYVLP